ncbi:MAG: hypothetical protein AAF195_01730 [Pseudomonadota bacterium]
MAVFYGADACELDPEESAEEIQKLLKAQKKDSCLREHAMLMFLHHIAKTSPPESNDVGILGTNSIVYFLADLKQNQHLIQALQDPKINKILIPLNVCAGQNRITSRDKGNHWISVTLDKNRKMVAVVDSLGKNYLNVEIKTNDGTTKTVKQHLTDAYPELNKWKFYYSKNQLQNKGHTCGDHVLNQMSGACSDKYYSIPEVNNGQFRTEVIMPAVQEEHNIKKKSLVPVVNPNSTPTSSPNSSRVVTPSPSDCSDSSSSDDESQKPTNPSFSNKNPYYDNLVLYKDETHNPDINTAKDQGEPQNGYGCFSGISEGLNSAMEAVGNFEIPDFRITEGAKDLYNKHFVENYNYYIDRGDLKSLEGIICNVGNCIGQDWAESCLFKKMTPFTQRTTGNNNSQNSR